MVERTNVIKDKLKYIKILLSSSVFSYTFPILSDVGSGYCKTLFYPIFTSPLIPNFFKFLFIIFYTPFAFI